MRFARIGNSRVKGTAARAVEELTATPGRRRPFGASAQGGKATQALKGRAQREAGYRTAPAALCDRSETRSARGSDVVPLPPNLCASAESVSLL
jgi:hypothetical protein